MRKADVLKYFKDNGAAVARALGITRGAVHLWGDIIPEAKAYRLQEFTRGKLKVDSRLYRERDSQVSHRKS